MKSEVRSPKSQVTILRCCIIILVGSLVVLLLGGCVNHQKFVGTRPFDFKTDTFAYANSLRWDYRFDENGKWVHTRHEPVSDYTHHCFVVARSARQFFQHVRFDPNQPTADETTYRRLIRQVVGRDPARVVRENNRIVIPGYANLRTFSETWEKLLKVECGGAWRSYFQRGHWRMIMPFRRANQERMAEEFRADLKQNRPPVVHLVRFPQLSINHCVLVFEAKETEKTTEFSVYDPYRPDEPKILFFDRASRTFSFEQNDYWPGGRLNAYEVYRNWVY
jgi:hypothetical protein